jgi:hypothetical protein
MSVIDALFRGGPAAAKWCEEMLKHRSKQVIPHLNLTSAGEPINSVLLVRNYGSSKKGGAGEDENSNVEKVDAVLDFISRIDDARHIRIDQRCVVVNKEEFALTPAITAQLRETTSESADSIHLTLTSTKLRISELRAWIDDVHTAYVTERSNRLGNRIFYFNEIPSEPPKTIDPNTKEATYRMELAPKTLQFSMNEFKTFKSFANIYGEHVSELKERLDLFVNHPEWYKARGIPHSLGVLLHGKPGAGKTSTIKAIAHDTHRHIFNLSLRPTTTQKQLSALFYNENVTVVVDGQVQTYKIPLNKRIYVFEDVDCLTDVVLDRELLAAMPAEMLTKPVEGGLNMSYLLNLFDGVLETPGRILVMTTNYPERLDRALVRPGRIDVNIAFGNATRAMLCEMVNHFYGLTLAVEEIPVEAHDFFTPAEAMEILCTHFKDHEGALVAMRRRATEVSVGVKAMLGTAVILEDVSTQANETIVIGEPLPMPPLIADSPAKEKAASIVSPINGPTQPPAELPSLPPIDDNPTYDQLFELGDMATLYEKFKTNPDGAKDLTNNLAGLYEPPRIFTPSTIEGWGDARSGTNGGAYDIFNSVSKHWGNGMTIDEPLEAIQL